MRTKRMLWQLFPSFLLIILIALIPVTWYATHSLRSLAERQTAADLGVTHRERHHAEQGGERGHQDRS